MKTSKKIMAFAMAAMLTFSLCPISAQAADKDINSYTDFANAYSDGDVMIIKADNITGTSPIVIGNKSLTLDLNNKTVTVGCIILSGTAELTIKNGTLKSGDYPLGNLITANGTSKVNIQNAKLICGKSNSQTTGWDAVALKDSASAIITDCEIKGGSTECGAGGYLGPGSALFLEKNTSTAVVNNSTLELGDGGDYTFEGYSPISTYGSGTVYNGFDNSVIKPPLYRSEADKKPLIVSSGGGTGNNGTITGITEGTNSASADVTANYTAGSAADAVYSVDIAWGSLAFTYKAANQGTWNPADHSFNGSTEAAWSCADGADVISVTNHSNKAIDAGFAYTKKTGFETIAVAFSSASLSLPSAEGKAVDAADLTGTTTITLTGELAENTANAAIGSVKVTVSPAATVPGEGGEIGGGTEGPDA